MEISYLKIETVSIPMHVKSSPNRRKTISLRVAKTWLHINTPVKYNQTIFDRFLVSKHAWILRMREKMSSVTHEREYVSWESFYYKWKQYRLKVVLWDVSQWVVVMTWGKLQCTIPRWAHIHNKQEYVQQALNEWYKDKAFSCLVKETEKLITQYKFNDTIKVVVKDYKSIYGKCRAAKDISFNYHIIKFPLSIIRHIIIHELSHTKYMWHGKNFWNLVHSLDTHADKHRAWIKENGSKFIF